MRVRFLPGVLTLLVKEMKILVSNGFEIEINEEHLVVKDNKLYNTETNNYEGVEGDCVTFTTFLPSGHSVQTRGVVNGYTDGDVVKIRGVKLPYVHVMDKMVEHTYTVTSLEEEKSFKTDVVFAD